ncbi:MAG TPA: alkaline phosphatase family protein [Usitatibacter sp.]|nr:alkaline phosphatase family protein [Usitatibacter sp.]
MKSFRLLAASALASLALVLAACVSPGGGSGSIASAPPRLVVFIAVDGLPHRQFVDYREQLAPDGLRRLLDRGAWFAQAHYGHAHTATAPGHATMLTGAYPHRTGIIGNEWRDPNTGAREYCTGDAAHKYIGHKTEALDGTSPKNLLAETVGDVLKRVNARSKVIAISGKDRGAILPGGKTGVAYMYMDDSGQFASSTYYMQSHPAWVDAFHARKPADRFFGMEWKPLLADSAYARSVPDEQKWMAKGGKLPKKMGEGLPAAGGRLYKDIIASPFSDQLTLEFARAAIAGESLGADDAPDILAVSLSGHDYVNHSWSAESRLSHDHVLHLDRALEAFFRDLDSSVGKDRYLVVFTSDHGFTPAPEHSVTVGRDAGRHNLTATVNKASAALEKKYGPGKWIVARSASTVLFNRKLAAEKGVDLKPVVEEARRILLAEPAIAAVYTLNELTSGARKGEPFVEAMRKAAHSQRSGELHVTLKPWWIISSGSGSAATHGAPHEHDTHVPLAFYGPAWVKPGRFDARVEIVDIAPTLAQVLGVPSPAQSEGRVLPIVQGR